MVVHAFLLQGIVMQKTVKVTRKGQTTIPAEIRKKLQIKEGDVLAVETVDQTVMFKRVPKLEELAGVFAGTADINEIKKELDKLREEY
ncbi:MAG: AbrB/MazE/SpoVT family DNA-binding domain-containing protein [Candidatus Bathyarchaeota archaeon]|jgi:AbrB family looped-hinge helix DNA binding protein|nr:AbrB/MazE/SpoVT family DNA-binding domain-containing protein [Candidatus Bathyarchaeota archaeon]